MAWVIINEISFEITSVYHFFFFFNTSMHAKARNNCLVYNQDGA